MEMMKDPVCGMMVHIGSGSSASHQGLVFWFCSDLCKRTFLAAPEQYAAKFAGFQHEHLYR